MRVKYDMSKRSRIFYAREKLNVMKSTDVGICNFMTKMTLSFMLRHPKDTIGNSNVNNTIATAVASKTHKRDRNIELAERLVYYYLLPLPKIRGPLQKGGQKRTTTHLPL